MPWLRSQRFPGPAAYAAAVWVPAVIVFGLVFGAGWIALAALAAWIVLFVVVGLMIGMVVFEHWPRGLFGRADTLVIAGTASLLSALIVAGFLGA